MPDRPTPVESTATLASREVDAILEQGLRLIRERSDAVLNAVDDGIYVLDHQGHTIFANEAAIRLLGFTLREMLGRPQHGLIHYSRPDGSEYPLEECPIWHSVNDGIYERVGGDVFWRKDGRPLMVDYTSTPIKEGRRVLGAVVTFRDATDQHVARAQAAEIERGTQALDERDRALSEAVATVELMEQALELLPAAVSATQGPEHRIVLANAQARRLAGGRPLVGRTVVEAFPELAGQEVLALRDRVLATGEPIVARGVAITWGHDGDGIPRSGSFDVTYLPVRDADGLVTGVLTYASESAGDRG